MEEDSDVESNSSFYEEPPRYSEEIASDTKSKSLDSQRKRGPKRPDKPLYMPRAVRQRLTSQNPSGPPGGSHVSSAASSSCTCISTSSDSCSCSDTAESTQSSSKSNQETLSGGADSISDSVPDGSPVCPQDDKQDLVLRLHETEPSAWDQTVSHFTALTLEEDELDKGDLASVPNNPQPEDTNTDLDEVTEEVISFSFHKKSMIYIPVIHQIVFSRPGLTASCSKSHFIASCLGGIVTISSHFVFLRSKPI